MQEPETAGETRRAGWKWALFGLGIAALLALVAATVVSLVLHGRGEIAHRRGRSSGSGMHAGIQARDFAFLPQAVEAAAGRPLTLTLSDVGLSHHTFTVQELNVDVVLAPGETKTVTVTPKAREKIYFFCRYHHAQGMQGFIQVA